MSIMKLSVERHSVISTDAFETVVDRLHAAIGHPDLATFFGQLSDAPDEKALAAVVRDACAGSDFMEFVALDYAPAFQPKFGFERVKCKRFIIGNPIVMQSMARHVIDAAAYAPTTLLIDERADGVHVSYDAMASLLEPYGNEAATRAAEELDRKVLKLLAAIAGVRDSDLVQHGPR